MSSSETNALETYLMDDNPMSRDAPEILASLRIGSDDYALSNLAHFLGISANKVHEKGNRELVRAPDKYFTYRISFANSGDDPLPDLDAIDPWLSCRLSCLEQAPSVPALLRSYTVEATLWIYIGGYPVGSIPVVEPTIRQRAAKLNVTIYFEHYFDRDSDEETDPWPTRLVIKPNTDDYVT